jgi:hypothetical protein
MDSLLPIPVERALYELFLAVNILFPAERRADFGRLDGLRARIAARNYFVKNFFPPPYNGNCTYPNEYIQKLQKHLNRNPRPVVRASLESLVREGYFDLAGQIQEFLRLQAPHLL